jgi:hypothetical protein
VFLDISFFPFSDRLETAVFDENVENFGKKEKKRRFSVKFSKSSRKSAVFMERSKFLKRSEK